MKKKLISIQINVPIEKLFEYTINPKHTNLWFDSIEKEWIEGDKKIDIGVIYKNQRKNGIICSYKLINFEKNKIFHLKSLDSDIEVIYYYSKVDGEKSKLDYYLNSNDSELIIYIKKALEKLKNILEN